MNGTTNANSDSLAQIRNVALSVLKSRSAGAKRLVQSGGGSTLLSRQIRIARGESKTVFLNLTVKHETATARTIGQTVM